MQSYTPYTDGQPGTPVFTRYYFGGAYETTGSAWKKYYSFGGTTLIRDASGFKYFLSDHLGSVSVVLDANGAILEQQRYLPFGEVREDIGSISQTDFGYTSQRKLAEGMGGIMDYRARFYSPALGRFIQPDSIIPGLFKPQSWNRYAYVLNNPIMFNDPSGHCVGPQGHQFPDGHPACNGGGNNGGGGGSNSNNGGGNGGGNNSNNNWCTTHPWACGGSTPGDPFVDLKTNSEADPAAVTKDLLENCIYDPYNPSCASVLPPETCDLGPFITTPGDTRNHTGCVYMGTTTYIDWNLVDKGDLFFDALGIIGSVVLLFGAIGIFTFAPALAFYEFTQVAGLAYDIYKLDSEALTLDLVLEVVDQTNFVPRLVPGLGAVINFLNIGENLHNAQVTVPVYEPYPRIPYIGEPP